MVTLGDKKIRKREQYFLITILISANYCLALHNSEGVKNYFRLYICAESTNNFS